MASSLDQFGELVPDASTAEQVAADYRGLAATLTELGEDVWLSIDLSHLGLDIEPRWCAERLAAVAEALPAGRRIQVEAEDHDRADAVLECVLAAAEQGLTDRLGVTVQANLRRSP